VRTIGRIPPQEAVAMPRRPRRPADRPVGLGLAIVLGLTLSGALPAAAQDAEPRPPGPPSATPLVDPPATPAGDGTGVRLVTDLGDIVIGLFTETAPVASENFRNLVEAGYYDGLTFHRLVPDFVIQGGDPSGDGTGGPGYTIRDEPVVGRYGRGIVAMARTPAPDSQGSQFFVVLDDGAEPALEHFRTYTIFGRVVEGMDVVDAIAAGANSGDPDNRALEPVRITRAAVETVALPPEPEGPPPSTGEAGGDPALLARVPESVAGLALERFSATGAELLAGQDLGGPAGELVVLLESVGGSVAGFSVASGQVPVEGGFVGILAVRLEGVDAALLVEGLPGALLGFEGTGVAASATIGGRDVTVLEPAPDAPVAERLHLVVDGDVLWIVLAPESHLDEAIGSLGP
jgi:cyclophilin family peptidyl-prolyl cis-trans isomerase